MIGRCTRLSHDQTSHSTWIEAVSPAKVFHVEHFG
jgi:hypothetical protein